VLNPICHLLALLEAHHILHVFWIRVNHERFYRFVSAAAELCFMYVVSKTVSFVKAATFLFVNVATNVDFI